MKDFFISYNSTDKAWAEWIAWQLEENGYSIVIQAWDSQYGQDFVEWMNNAVKESDRTIAVLSPAYLESEARFSKMERNAALYAEKLLPVRIQNTDDMGLLGPIAYIDLVGLDEDQAKEKLLRDVVLGRKKPQTAPMFPGAAKHTICRPNRFPGELPPIWNVPYLRNRNFTGREALLTDLKTSLISQQITAIHGLGGVGKTQLALEYAYRYHHAYEVVWWLRSENASTLDADYASLAEKLNLPEKDAKEQSVRVAAVRQWLNHHPDWLLIFDNAQNSAAVRPYLPQASTGQVLITSRYVLHWESFANSFKVSTFTSQESVEFLLKRTDQHDQNAASTLAEELGHLPLALAQAGGYIKSMNKSLADYLKLYRQYEQKIISRGQPPIDYPNTVATTWELSFEQAQQRSTHAGPLLNLCAFLAPDDIPRDLLRQGLGQVQESVCAPLADESTFDEAVAALHEFSLIEARSEAFSLHRMVQAVTRACLAGDKQKAWTQLTLEVVDEAWPSGSFDVRAWPACARLQPHALAIFEHAETLKIESTNLAALLNGVGLYLHGRAAYINAEPLHRRALEIREKLLGPEHPDVAQSLNDLAELLRPQGKYTEAEPLYRRALEIRETQLGLEHPNFAQSLNNLAELLRFQGKIAEAEPLQRRALEIREKLLGPEHPDVAESLNNLAILLEYTEAEPLLRRALKIREMLLGPEHPDVAQSLNYLANMLNDQGKYTEAEPRYRRALKIREMQLGPEHPKVATSLNNLALLLATQGEYAEAEPLCRRALEIYEKRLSPEHPFFTQSLNSLAGLLDDQGKYSEAEPLYRRALEIREKQLGSEHPNVAQSLNNLASLFLTQGKYAEAEPLYRRALEILEKQLGPEHPDVATSLNNLAGLFRAQGKHADAEPLCRRALDIFEKQLGPEHPHTKIVRKNLESLQKQ